MGSVFGKGGDSAPPAATMDPMMGEQFANMMVMFDELTSQMGNMMLSQQESSRAMMESMQMSQMPTVQEAPDVDWRAKQEELNSKMRADYDLEAARRKGSQDTVLTSPLLDEEEDVNLTQSVLAEG